jgi:hypothetical protein
MSANATVATAAVIPASRKARGHRIRLLTLYGVAIILLLALAVYGFDYYTLDAVQRPLSAKHALLKPSGVIGVKLGMLGLFMFLAIFVYPIRKRWPWLAKQGNARHWLDIHVMLGLSAPLIVAFHASFKFRGVAGMAFWIMAAVALSGVVGRYLYGQIPRSLSAAEMSFKESQELQAQYTQQLSQQSLISAVHLEPLFRLPSTRTVEQFQILLALGYMFALDCARPFHVARLRCRILPISMLVTTLGGLLPSGNAEMENVIRIARQQAALSKRILFLTRSQQVFHLWHVVHRPFSYSFAVLACIHIGVVLLLGYM